MTGNNDSEAWETAFFGDLESTIDPGNAADFGFYTGDGQGGTEE